MLGCRDVTRLRCGSIHVEMLLAGLPRQMGLMESNGEIELLPVLLVIVVRVAEQGDGPVHCQHILSRLYLTPARLHTARAEPVVTADGLNVCAVDVGAGKAGYAVKPAGVVERKSFVAPALVAVPSLRNEGVVHLP